MGAVQPTTVSEWLNCITFERFDEILGGKAGPQGFDRDHVDCAHQSMISDTMVHPANCTYKHAFVSMGAVQPTTDAAGMAKLCHF
jgi:hypothetical protein